MLCHFYKFQIFVEINIKALFTTETINMNRHVATIVINNIIVNNRFIALKLETKSLISTPNPPNQLYAFPVSLLEAAKPHTQ